VNRFGGILGTFGLAFWALVVGILIMVLIILFRQDELAATIVIAISLCLDFYLSTYIVAQILALALLLIFFIAQSPRYPWVAPRALWLWTLFLLLALLAIFPSTQATFPFGGIRYYLKVFLASFIIFWIGMTIARDITKVRLLFSLLIVFGAFDAIVTNIQAITGVMLFSTSRYEASLQLVGNYQLGATNISRAGAFLINPNPNACFLAMTLLMALGLLFDASSLLSKAFYLTLTLPIFLALLFTYSTEGLLGALAGIIVLIALAGNRRIRLFLLLLIFGGALVVIVFLPAQVGLFLQHASNPGELQLRNAAWQTGIRVIQAFPLTGLGLGSYVYQVQAEPYRVLAQYHVLDHPHNSYLEFAALAGLPVLIVFLTLLLFALGLALRNWVQADKRSRTLLGTGVAVVIVLSVVSLSDAGWTFFPLATLGWLVLGVISSPLLSKGLGQPIMQQNNL